MPFVFIIEHEFNEVIFSLLAASELPGKDEHFSMNLLTAAKYEYGSINHPLLCVPPWIIKSYLKLAFDAAL